jgi:Uncharacterized proteins of the AP superfamily
MKKLLTLAVLCLAAVACSRTPDIEHVFLIGLDGMSSAAFVKADMPYCQSLMKEGTYTVKKRSVLPSSSAINWASMFMGAPTEIHGYTTWGSKTPELPSRVIGENGIFPTVFQLARQKYPSAEIGVLYDWDGIKYLVDTISLSHFAQTPSIDPENMAGMASDYILAKKPMLAAFIFDNPDHIGHQDGWETEEYQKMLTRLDACVRQVVEAIDEAGIRKNSVIIITADHGGIGRNHGSITLNEMETPFIIVGPGIPEGACLDDKSMMQYDVASTIAALLKLDQPQVWTGRSVI